MSSKQELEFRYSLPQAPDGKLVALSLAEAEEVLLSKLHSAQEDDLEPMWQLARLYSHSKQHEKALNYLRQILSRQPDPEHKAATVLAMGQTMEQVGDYETAVRYYREAFAFEPMNTRTWYFINNNLGFSLNMLGRFAEGEQFCRAAIRIDEQRPNGFKNLGIALGEQQNFAEAADCFIKATQADASDTRALKLLEALLAQRPELLPQFEPQLICCRSAVETARRKIASSTQPVVHTGWRKRWLMLRTRISSWWRRLRY